MRVIFCLSAVACVLAAMPAAADEFVPTAYPFLPELVVNNEPDVCGPFHAVVTDAFLGPDFEISIVGREWPEAEVEIPNFRQVSPPDGMDDDWSEKFVAAIVDIDGNGQEEVIAQASQQYGWRGNTYFLVLYPSRESFENAIGPVRVNGVRGVNLEQVFADAIDLTPQGGSGRIQATSKSADGDGKKWQWTWSDRPVLEINRRTYLLDEAEPTQRGAALSLWRLESDGRTDLACRVTTVMGPVDKVTDQWGLAFTPLAGTSVEDFQNQLRRISGEEVDGGTLHAHSNMLLRAEQLSTQLATRPWVAADGTPYNSRESIDAALWLWGTEGIWNFRQTSRLPSFEAKALQEFTIYYRDAFGIDEKLAARRAKVAINQLLGSYFIFPGSWADRVDSEVGFWTHLRESVMDGPQVALLNGTMPSRLGVRYATAREQQDWPFDQGAATEPILFYALEHPKLVQSLLDRGIRADARNDAGKTALMYAAHLDLPDTAEILVAAGADPNAQTATETSIYFYRARYRQRTALMYALENAKLDMVELLLEAGANPNAVDSEGRDALDYLALNHSLTKSQRAEIEVKLRSAGYRPAAP